MDNDIKSLEELAKEISNLLLNCMVLLEIFDEISDGNNKESFFINSLQKNVKIAFEYIEKSRHIISKPD